ncbi:MAG: hypothetical protein KA761_00200 [Gemmatimonadaceae bacterium]|nr:hypothetical protein [Gemmatimonadaceae bacterium]
MEFDLDAVDTRSLSEQGVWLTLKTLDGEPLKGYRGRPVRLLMHGPDSEKFRRALRVATAKRMAPEAIDAERKADPVELAEQAERDSIEMLVTCIKGWENVPSKDKAEVRFTREAARALITAYPIIREQAEQFYAFRRNFVLASSSGSSPTAEASSPGDEPQVAEAPPAP